MMDAMPRRLAAALLIAALAGCARPYSGPKTLAAIGTGLLVGGGTAWVVGERTGNSGLTTPGAVTAAIGAVLVIGAAGWLAQSIACAADPDCPEGEECRELPAPPGGVPYKQCVRR
jgi:hypothetical protein